ncbi:MAG: PIG-L family deacetylase [archaeon]
MEKIIIFATHQDDEAIGTGGLIAQTLRKGAQLKIVYTTTENDVRKEEAERVMKTVGVKKESLIFYDYQTLKNKIIVKEAIIRTKKILRKENPTNIFVPSYEGGHIDHDLTSYIVNETNEKRIPTYEYPLYNNYPLYIPIKIMRRYTVKWLPFIHIFPPLFIPRQTRVIKLRMSDEDIRIKRDMLKGYMSQNKNDYLIKNFLYIDKFRLCPNYNYKRPPHGLLPLNYTITRKQSFKEFRELIS